MLDKLGESDPTKGLPVERLPAELTELAGAKGPETAARRLTKLRDLTLVRLAGPLYLVVACDSDGGLGPKPHDTVPVPPELLGRFAARVPLMEILASGARPLVLVDTLSVEMEPTGRAIIEGVKFEAALAGIAGEGAVTGSTEDNVPTTATGVGVTVIGLVMRDRLRPGTSAPGDVVASVGVPKSAPADEVKIDDPDLADVPTVAALAGLPFVHDILPVGSKGIAYEAGEMAASAGLAFEPSSPVLVPGGTPSPVDAYKSAGPSTCVLVSLPPERLAELAGAVAKPVSLVGRLKSPGRT